MKQISFGRLTVVLCLLLVGACIGSQEGMSNIQELEIPTSETTSSQTMTPEASPTVEMPTMAPSEAPMLPTPSLPSWVAEDFFFGGNSSECRLPCWQGLTLGKSGSADIQSVFNTMFGFTNSTYDLVGDPDNVKVAGMFEKSHSWIMSEWPLEFFTISVWVNEDTEVLQGLNFRWRYTSENDLDARMSAQRIIQILGEPSYMLTAKSVTEQGDTGIVDLLMIYNSGLAVYTSLHVPITRTTGKPAVEFCLGGERWNGSYNAADREAYIMEPLTDALDRLSPLQQRFIGIIIEDYGLRPFEEVFGVDSEGVTQLVLQGGNTCFYTDLWDE